MKRLYLTIDIEDELALARDAMSGESEVVLRWGSEDPPRLLARVAGRESHVRHAELHYDLEDADGVRAARSALDAPELENLIWDFLERYLRPIYKYAQDPQEADFAERTARRLYEELEDRGFTFAD